MRIIASFIGIDKYADQDIRELTGARRDATALWALFSDTIPDIKAELLINKEATAEAIRASFDSTLGAAGSEDIVIISYSGHGSHDHRIATYDTSLDALADTTVSMEELATRFKESQAKIVICILDCCFSGGAPARVLEMSPVPRDIRNPYQVLAGEGRILIAGSNFDELSYELPGADHGLLTKALIDVLQTGDGTIELQGAMGEVMSRVRAEAARMGVEQTPVLAGNVVGGLTLPTLRPGQHFYQAFPELQGVKISSTIKDLSAFGLPDSILKEWSENFTNGLNKLQLEAVNTYRILDGDSLLVVAPTSSGKTFIGELAAVRSIIEGRKAVFLLPYRALVNEKYDQFVELYEKRLGMRIIRCTGDYQDQTANFVKGKYDLAILTYEMFLNLALNNSSVLNQIGLVVLDEAQFITDPRRGITVELLLTYLLTVREQGVCPQLIALSAVIGDVNDFDAWLGCKKLVTTERPVPLIEGVLDRSGIFQFLDISGNVQTKQLLPSHVIRIRRDKASMQDLIVPLVQMLVGQNEKIIVFRNQRGTAQGCARYLAKDLGLSPAANVMKTLPRHDLSTTSTDLRTCLEGGTAFHNTNLTREEKAVVEKAFRDPDGSVRVLAATTTVAAGINTPASTVILAEQEFIGDDGREFTIAEYKNMAGRAGRLGYKEEGKAIILAENSYQRESLFQRYVMGKPEMLHSSFNIQDLNTWVVRLLAQIKRIPRTEVPRLLMNTFGGYFATKKYPGWRAEMEERIETIIERMITLELVEQEGEWVKLTLLGYACGRSALSLESAMRLVELMRTIPVENLTVEKLMGFLQLLRESDGGYTPVMKRGTKESIRPGQAGQRYGVEVARALQRFAEDEFDYYARCKRAAILWDWVEGKSIEEIEQFYSTTPYQGKIGHGDIRRFADATRFHLRSAYQIVTLIFVDKGPSQEAVETLLKQLEVGIPANALGLISLPLSFARGEYLALYKAGVKDANDFWGLSAESLKELLGATRSIEVEQYRPQ